MVLSIIIQCTAQELIITNYPPIKTDNEKKIYTEWALKESMPIAQNTIQCFHSDPATQEEIINFSQLKDKKRFSLPQSITFSHLFFDPSRTIAAKILPAKYKIDIIKVNTPTSLKLIGSIPNASEISNISFDPSGTRLATASNYGIVHIFDLTTLTTQSTPRKIATFRHHKGVSSVCFSPSGDLLITECADGKTRIFKEYEINGMIMRLFQKIKAKLSSLF